MRGRAGDEGAEQHLEPGDVVARHGEQPLAVAAEPGGGGVDAAAQGAGREHRPLGGARSTRTSPRPRRGRRGRPCRRREVRRGPGEGSRRHTGQRGDHPRGRARAAGGRRARPRRRARRAARSSWDHSRQRRAIVRMMARMDPEFAAYLERVRAHRAELGESMAALDAALALPVGLGVAVAPSGPGGADRARARPARPPRDHRGARRALCRRRARGPAPRVGRQAPDGRAPRLRRGRPAPAGGARGRARRAPKPLRHTGKRRPSSSAGSSVTASAGPTSSTRPTRSTSAARAETRGPSA